MKTGFAHYHLCPRCFRAVPEMAGEVYCPNDGTRLLTACPVCNAPILSPNARYCARCGQAYTTQRESRGKEARHPSGRSERRRA